MSSEDKEIKDKEIKDNDNDNDKEIKEPKNQEMRREITYENNSDMSIDELKQIKELNFRKDFNKWVVVGEEKQKKPNYFFGIFN
tara:strand:- start:251 stop:502 length:252 start_codon:yes stop_codon:yes gene_type:complete